MFRTLILSLSTPWTLLKALGRILGSIKLMGLCMVPAAIGILSFILSFTLFIIYRVDLTGLLGINPESWWFGFTSWIIVVLSIFVSAFMGFAFSSILGGFFIDELVDKFLVAQKLKHSDSNNKFNITGILFSVSGEIVFILLLAFFGLLVFITSFIPPIALFSAILGMILVGASFFHTALAQLEYGLAKRMALLLSLTLPSLALGAIFTLALVIPFAGAVLLPVFHGAAVILLSEYLAVKD